MPAHPAGDCYTRLLLATYRELTSRAGRLALVIRPERTR